MDAVMSYLKNQWDRVGAWVCVAAGAAALLIGYLGVSDTIYTHEQIPYVVSGGLVGIFLLGLGAMLWVSADLRDEWRKLDAIDRHLVANGKLPQAGEVPAPQAGRAEAPNPKNSLVVPQEVSLR
jgi:hypothetical protein